MKRYYVVEVFNGSYWEPIHCYETGSTKFKSSITAREVMKHWTWSGRFKGTDIRIIEETVYTRVLNDNCTANDLLKEDEK